MNIDFERTGGFAGLRLEIELNTDALDRDLAVELQDLVQGSGFFDLRPLKADRNGGADRFRYRLRISSPEHGDHQVMVSENRVPERLQPLLMRLTGLALHRRSDSATPDEPDL
jgi:Emfourin